LLIVNVRVAVSNWEGRISPLFDVTDHVLLVEIEGGKQRTREQVLLTTEDPLKRACFFVQVGVEVIICGSISKTMKRALMSEGIEVISHISGGVEEAVEAYIEGRLDQGK
jgi:predicted Fe-Mo cluster-binding NifX family protein